MSNLPPTGWQPSGDPKADAKAAQAYAKAQRPWFKKKRFIIPIAIVVIVVLMQLAGGEDSSPSDNSTDTNSKSSESPSTGKTESKKSEKKVDVTKVDAATLLKAFEENELQGDQKYKGKRLQITGVVSKIDTDVWNDDKYILQIGTGADFEILTVNCHGIPQSKLAKLKVGEDVTVVGDFDDGGSLGVEIKKCSIV